MSSFKKVFNFCDGHKCLPCFINHYDILDSTYIIERALCSVVLFLINSLQIEENHITFVKNDFLKNVVKISFKKHLK